MHERKENVELVRRRKLLFHATHRGTRELDTLIGRYVKETIETMSRDEMLCVEDLLSLSDARLTSCFFEGGKLDDDRLMQLITRMKRAYIDH